MVKVDNMRGYSLRQRLLLPVLVFVLAPDAGVIFIQAGSVRCSSLLTERRVDNTVLSTVASSPLAFTTCPYLLVLTCLGLP